MAYSVKRQKFRLINREIQLGLAWRMMIAFTLFLLLGIVMIFAPSVLRLVSGSRMEEVSPAAREFLVLHERIWPAVFVTLAGVFAYTVYFSMRIAGPIYRINSTLRKMLAGEYPRDVTLRNGDYFRETAELLQRLSRELAERSGEKVIR